MYFLPISTKEIFYKISLLFFLLYFIDSFVFCSCVFNCSENVVAVNAMSKKFHHVPEIKNIKGVIAVKKCTVILFVLVFLLFSAVSKVSATPISSAQAENVVKNWLVGNSKPMGSSLGGQVVSVTLFQDAASGSAGYYFVQLDPTGWYWFPQMILMNPF